MRPPFPLSTVVAEYSVGVGVAPGTIFVMVATVFLTVGVVPAYVRPTLFTEQ